MIFDSFVKHMKDVFSDNEIISKELEKLDNDYLKVYCDIMNDFRRDLLYVSDIHGINHNIRTSIFTLVISSSEKLPIEDFALALEGAKYHDTGRINDFEDYYHGKRSSEIIDFLREKYSEEDLSYLKAIVEAHSIPDKEKDKMIDKYKLQDKERYYRLLNVLKDSDGLDRVRINDLNPKYLRTEKAKELPDFAYELFENYDKALGVKVIKR